MPKNRVDICQDPRDQKFFPGAIIFFRKQHKILRNVFNSSENNAKYYVICVFFSQFFATNSTFHLGGAQRELKIAGNRQGKRHFWK